MSPASYLTAPPRGVIRIVAPSLRWTPCGIGRSGPRASSPWFLENDRRLGRSRHEHDASARRPRRGRAHRGAAPRDSDHAPRRGCRRAAPPPPSPDRTGSQRPLRLPRTAESLGAERTLLVATSAVRDAENGEAFLGEIEWSYGFATRLLSGDEEAQLTFRGAAVGRDLAEETLLVDIGGGSTEFVVGGPD